MASAQQQQQMHMILPGDSLPISETDLKSHRLVLGPGLYTDPKTLTIHPVNAGKLYITQNNNSNRINIHIDYESHRYIPHVNDLVIGCIVGTFADSYKVSLNSFSNSVSLSYMAFPNASKKNRPTLKIGDLVYCKVATAVKELEATVECLESGFGLLEDGMIIDSTGLKFVRLLLFDDQFPLLRLLASRTKFEIAIGVNGKIWIKADEIKDTLACYRSILDCSMCQSVDQFANIIKKHFQDLNTVAAATAATEN
ncbi:exosome non-catalytic core subunit RRP40 NDAI_0G03750 [Naumovozyma dairenensis CBS 421]|uniref:Ribosomal RNA-processing protein 40 n=1 Tax=Naumovozyma dairenensis (strain ATCC 10597 / BCRC 20456 / CBS 421 / NBRC 0211 / NRRL Y-12639) TaxID=1071378 RepID=G0WEE1_NAUDC|nr:hypothetical protein NDAI_0G03750 [Naumovozyma dairenensis CBS 421]CCD26152.2 hypothetical protein NDAI_0G03750 [Naumovozyma dairenensis CBS 421]